MDPAARKRSPFMPLFWVISALVGCSVSVVAVILMGMQSEQKGIDAVQVAAFPFGFLLCAAISGVVVHAFMKRASHLLRLVAPLSCGCLGGGSLLGSVLLFFMTLWASL